MAKLVILFGALLLLVATVRAPAQELSLGPEVMTFPEIAERLSIGGITVKCPPELRQQAAFVYLK